MIAEPQPTRLPLVSTNITSTELQSVTARTGKGSIFTVREHKVRDGHVLLDLVPPEQLILSCPWLWSHVMLFLVYHTQHDVVKHQRQTNEAKGEDATDGSGCSQRSAVTAPLTGRLLRLLSFHPHTRAVNTMRRRRAEDGGEGGEMTNVYNSS